MKTKTFFTFILLLLGISLIPSLGNKAFSQIPTVVRVVFDRENRETTLQGLNKGDVIYVPINKLADLLNLKHFPNDKNQKTVLRVGAKSIKLTASNPFIMVDDQGIQMPLPTLYENREIYVPLVLFLKRVGSFFPTNLNYNNQSRVLTINRFLYNITSVGVEERDNGFIIRLKTTRDFKESDVSISVTRDWLYITLMGGKVDTLQLASEKQQGIVTKIVPFQFEDSAQLTFMLNRKTLEEKVYINSGEVLISLRSRNSIDAASLQPAVDVGKWRIDRIILDPGHGGKHPGAVGQKGTKEKDITLDIAKRLKKLIEDRLHIEVLMTRDDDSFVGLKERTQFANAKKGKLFISIHANANRKRSMRGYSTWVLGQGKTEEALEVAEKENSVIEYEESTEVYDEYKSAAHILNALAQNVYLKESLDLAQIVNLSLKSKTKIPQWGKGVYQAGFYVLIGAAMPSILVETAFLSNTYEERQLRTRSFRQKLAEALCESIKTFVEKYERGIG